MTYAPKKFEVATSDSIGEDAFTRKTVFELCTKYPEHHVAYTPAKFECAFTIKYII